MSIIESMTQLDDSYGHKTADSDVDLVQAMAAGDTRALHTLYTRHGAAILTYLLGLLSDHQLAEEVLQDVMLAAWQSASRFRGNSKVRTWLIAIARYKALNVRQRQKQPSLTPFDELMLSDTSQAIDQQLDSNQEKTAVYTTLQQLPSQYRETLELIFYHNLSGSEAASILGVAPGTVKSRLHRAKALFKKRFKLGNE